MIFFFPAAGCRVICFDQNRSIPQIEEFLHRERIVNSKTDAVAKRHLRQRGSSTALSNSMHGTDLAIEDGLMKKIAMTAEYIKIRHIFCIPWKIKEQDCIAGLLEFRRNNMVGLFRYNSKGYQCRRNSQVFKGAAHAVFPTNSGNLQFLLGHIRAEECADRLPPGFFIGTEALEKFLHRQISLTAVAAESYQFRYRLEYGIQGTVERAPYSHIRIISVRENAGSRRFAARDRNFGNHAFYGRLLIFTAKRHEYCPRSDGAVEPFGQSLFRCDIQRFHRFEERVSDITYRIGCKEIFFFRSRDNSIPLLCYAIGIEECPGDVDDVLIAPVHDQPFRVRSDSNDRRFQIFFRRVFHEFFHMFRSYYDSHAFLRFGNSQFRAIQTFIFFGNFIEIDIQAIGQFPNGDRHTAGAEVIAALDEDRHFMAAEQALDFPFRQRIALLDFSAAGFQRFYGMLFGRSRRAAHAITTGFAAQQDNDIPGNRFFPDNIRPRSRTENGTDFHTFCNKSLMIIFFYFSRRQTNLVAIGAVAFGSACRQRALRELSWQGIFNRLPGIAGAGDTHSLVYIGPAAQGIADTPAQAGSGTAERFNFCRMIMCFVFKEKKPFFFFSVYIDGDNNGAGIDFFGGIQIL